MNQEISLSLAALVVALVALLNTISQVLQQYYATADGYRRCSPSVMGEWARFSRRRFVWKEFRFETVFATPVIFLDVAYELKEATKHSSIVVLDGTHEMDDWPGLKTTKIKAHPPFPRWSVFGHEHHWAHGRSEEDQQQQVKRSRTLSSVGIKQFLRRNTPLMPSETQLERFLKLDNDPTGEHAENLPVTWIPLMQSLQQYSSSLRLCGLSVFQDSSAGSLRRGRVLAPAIRVSKKSWDFMPTDIVKPLALSNVRDVATIAQYLGCRWTNFQPEESVLRAEGDGIMVTSTEVKSFGTVISFIKTDSRSDERRRIHGIAFSPMEGAATLGFGIIFSDLLGGEKYSIYDLRDCQATVGFLSNSIQVPERLPTAVMETLITDLIGILTPIYRPFSTSITYVVRPSTFASENVASLQGNLVYFVAELRELVDSKHPDVEPTNYEALKGRLYEAETFLSRSKWSAALGRPIVAYRGYSDPKLINLLDNLQRSWESSSSFLTQHRIASRAVLGWHISTVLDSKQQVLNIQRQMPLRYPENMASARKQLMHFYFETCRQVCIKEAKAFAPDIVERIWIEMLFRGVMWHAIHNFDEKVVAVPPRYSDSNLPIYIA